ncbi:MAG: beta-lactamase family protein [Pseudomonadales bacterium]|nr:beta-lactamase family protein [Pseudomonadales bacterium]
MKVLNLPIWFYCVFLGALVVSSALPTMAKEIPQVAPKKVGVSGQRLQRITDYMDAAVEAGTMVGGMGVIARRGKIVYSQTYGLSDREANKVMQDDAIYRIYSMSKPITSVALMMLYEEGGFFLDDPVAKYIPQLANLKLALSTADEETQVMSDGTNTAASNASYSAVKSASAEAGRQLLGKTRKPVRQPTIRDLLRHTAGFSYGYFGNTEVDRLYRQQGILAEADLLTFVTDLGQLPLQYEPGSRWHYSVSVDVLGRLVEVLSGMKFSDFLQQRLFAPLDMQDTSFIVPAEKLPRLAQIYSPAGRASSLLGEAKLVPSGARINANYLPGATFESGGGGMVSTARDYLRFSQMLLNGGELQGVRILSPKTVELMTRNHLGELKTGFGRKGVGLGFAVALDQAEIGELGSVGEYNWGGAAGTRFWIDPQEQLIGLFLVQSIPHKTKLRQKFKVLTYQALID